MEIFEPNNFFQITGLIGNIITGLIAVSGLMIALLTYRVAEKALSVWKKEKEFDINIEGYANSLDAIKLLEDLRVEQYNPDLVKEAWTEVLLDIFNANEQEVYKSFINLFSYSKYYNTILKGGMLEMRKQAIKVLNVSSEKDLIDFYNKYISVEANMFAIHHNYHFSKINAFIKKYNYTKFKKENFAVCIYFNALKVKEPNTPDNKLYEDLYIHFFDNVGGDPLEGLRAQQVSFIFQKLNT